MRKGSITIFALLSMMLVASVLLALLEASRLQQVKDLTSLQTQVALESVFAEYHSHLWEEYRILACKEDDIVEKLETYGNCRITSKKEGINFFQFRVKDAELNGYTRLTDGEGSAFIQAAVGYMEKNIVYETAKTIYNQYEGMTSIQNQSGYSFLDIGKALDGLKEARESDSAENNKKINRRLNTQESVKASTKKEETDILEFIQTIQKKGILSLVLHEDASISQNSFAEIEKLSSRNMPEAFYPEIEEVDWYTKVLFQQYLLNYLSNYTKEKEHALDYEVEYLLVGKDSDLENLKGVVNQLLGLRTAANFMYLSSNNTKSAQAGALAVSIAGASANSILIETVKIAILSAWAFGESILDIRTLLAGEKIALLKSDTSWTLGIDTITNINKKELKAKHCSDGLSYQEYLGILLLLQQEKETAIRTMEVQELTLREVYKEEDMCMEEWVIESRASVSYSYYPVFFSIQKVIPNWDYEIHTTKAFAY